MDQVAQRYEEAVPVENLRPHPRNPNIGDVEGIRESIQENGWYGAVIAHDGTGTILAGKHRWDAARAEGAETVPVLWVSVDDDRAKRILVGDNAWAAKARRDESMLLALLREFEADGGLAGVGYGEGDLEALIKRLEPVPPTEFGSYGETISTNHACPKCGYQWSGPCK